MACQHPFGVEIIRDESGEIIGARCPACRMTTYLGDSFWTMVKRAVRSWWSS